MRKAFLAAALLALPLTACRVSEKPADETSAADTGAGESAETGGNGGVTREEAQPPAPVVQKLAPQPVIQSQPGPEGTQLDLVKVAVTGDILTVTLRCSSEAQFKSRSFDVKGISVIDDATSQRIAVLKDNDGNWMASNVHGDSIGTSCERTPGVIWAKFPAPPATSRTVSINLPEVAPFDGVPVTR